MNNNGQIIEEDEKISKALDAGLNAPAHQTSTAFDAMGMQKTLNTAPDAILRDITMPGGKGLTLAEGLKATTNVQDIPAIFLPASKQPNLGPKAMALGGTAFFEKSDGFTYLVAGIRAAIEHPNIGLSL
ncbi:MAG: response regulator [Nitrospirales bacterium]